jgi:hypothetical protein
MKAVAACATLVISCTPSSPIWLVLLEPLLLLSLTTLADEVPAAAAKTIPIVLVGVVEMGVIPVVVEYM